VSVADLFEPGDSMWDWALALDHARERGDVAMCLQLRREDAQRAGTDLEAAVTEELIWHAWRLHTERLRWEMAA
jgi:hypothetical protein